MKIRTWLLATLVCLTCWMGWEAQGEETPNLLPGEKYQQWWNAELQQEIDARIEKYRKADAEVTLSDVKPGTEVSVEQISHAFLFGAHIFNFDQLGSDECNARYKALYGTIFNSATIAFYWKAFEPEPGKPRYQASKEDCPEFWNQLSEPWKQPYWRRPSPEKVIEFCQSKGIAMHGHPIIWGNMKWNHPTWISKEPEKVAEMERLFEKRVVEIARYYKDVIPSWDVVNESVDPVPGQPRYGTIPEDYTFQAFQQAEKEFPASVQLNINDSWRAVYPPFIQDLIQRGAKIDVIGLQMHIFGSQPMLEIMDGQDILTNGTSWHPRKVEKYLEELDQFQRPIHLSEITIPAPGDDERANALQARLARDMYRLWFSWPSIYRITWWNVVDDCGASGEPLKSGLFTRQMEPKPVFHALNQLIHEEWKTRFTQKAENSDVTLKFRGFKGNYRITWTNSAGEKKIQEIKVL